MDWNDTLSNWKSCYKKEHLSWYSKREARNIMLTVTWIAFLGTLKGIWNSIIRRETPPNHYENENNIFKQWFCKTYADQVSKR